MFSQRRPNHGFLFFPLANPNFFWPKGGWLNPLWGPARNPVVLRVKCFVCELDGLYWWKCISYLQLYSLAYFFMNECWHIHLVLNYYNITAMIASTLPLEAWSLSYDFDISRYRLVWSWRRYNAATRRLRFNTLPFKDYIPDINISCLATNAFTIGDIDEQEL